VPGIKLRKATELRKNLFPVFCFLLSIFMVLAGNTAANAAKIPVVASIVPLGDFCRQLGGDRVTVQVLIPPGASPHIFEPPPSVIARAAQARLFVYTGAGLEPWAAKLLASRSSKNLEVVEAVQGLSLIKEAGGHHHGETLGEKQHHHASASGTKKAHDTHEVHRHAVGNPHVWLVPVLAQDICRRIAASLIRLDPGQRRYYEERLQDYLQKLAALNQEVQKQVASFRVRKFVCFHPSFSYFARRYGLQEAGVIELSPGREPTPRHLQKIVNAIKKNGIRVVFAEPQLNPRVAEVIAREAGVKVLLLDPVGGRPPYGENYLQLMRYNLGIMTQAMK